MNKLLTALGLTALAGFLLGRNNPSAKVAEAIKADGARQVINELLINPDTATSMRTALRDYKEGRKPILGVKINGKGKGKKIEQITYDETPVYVQKYPNDTIITAIKNVTTHAEDVVVPATEEELSWAELETDEFYKKLKEDERGRVSN